MRLHPARPVNWTLARAITLTLATMGSIAAAAEPAKEAPPTNPPPVQPVAPTDNAVKSPANPDVVRPDPKPLSEQTTKAIAWLAKQQLEDGGWDQGEVDRQQLRRSEPDRSNVGDTCIAALALLRAGSTPAKGEYAPHIVKALGFICGQVEKASDDGLAITDIRPTRLQSKLGPNIDTFAGALLLSEVRGKMPDAASNKRISDALNNILTKIEKNQKENGGWVDAHEGWASALCNSVANKAVNRAALAGAPVSEATITKAQKYASANLGKGSGDVKADGSAGVELYARSANLQNLQDADHVNQTRGKDLGEKRKAAAQRAEQAEAELAQAKAGPNPTPAVTQSIADKLATAQGEVAAADEAISGIEENSGNLKLAQRKVVERMADDRFNAGFGNNGGEEFFSYMNIGESLYAKGGEDFVKWDKAMTANMNKIQNEDGSWSGQHCITGRTFCTSAALLTLMVDRSAPVVQKDAAAK